LRKSVAAVCLHRQGHGHARSAGTSRDSQLLHINRCGAGPHACRLGTGGTHARLKPLSALFPSPPQRQPGGDDRLPAAVRLRRLPGALWRPARVDGLHRRGRVPGAHGRRAVAARAPARARARPRATSCCWHYIMVSRSSVWWGVRPGDRVLCTLRVSLGWRALQLVPRSCAACELGRS